MRLKDFIATHGGLFSVVLSISLMMFLVNVGLFAFLQNENIFLALKKISIGVHKDSALAGIPVYPGAVFATLSFTQLRFSYVYHGIWDSTDDVPAVADWYVNALMNQGWKLKIKPTDPHSQTEQYFVFQNKWSRLINLSLTANLEGLSTRITIDKGPNYEESDELIQGFTIH